MIFTLLMHSHHRDCCTLFLLFPFHLPALWILRSSSYYTTTTILSWVKSYLMFSSFVFSMFGRCGWKLMSCLDQITLPEWSSRWRQLSCLVTWVVFESYSKVIIFPTSITSVTGLKLSLVTCENVLRRENPAVCCDTSVCVCMLFRDAAGRWGPYQLIIMAVEPRVTCWSCDWNRLFDLCLICLFSPVIVWFSFRQIFSLTSLFKCSRF